MSNKDVFKELYSKKLNKEKNYNKIMETIERKNRRLNQYLKWSLASICLVVVTCGIIAFGGNIHSLLTPDKKVVDNNVILNINHVSNEKGLVKTDADVKEVNDYNAPYYEVLSDLEIPEDFDDKEYINAIYTKSDRDNKEYDYLMQYEKIYKNSSNHRNIVIGYSEKNKPIRDYYFVDGKVSKIDDFELIIYQYENSYMTEFKYKNLHIDIETSDITEAELAALLPSIIK